MEMFRELEVYANSLEVMIFEEPDDTLPFLLAKCPCNTTFIQMETLWIIAGKHIHEMYRENLKLKRGIGYRGSWTRMLENDISYTRGENFHLGTSLWRVP